LGRYVPEPKTIIGKGRGRVTGGGNLRETKEHVLGKEVKTHNLRMCIPTGGGGGRKNRGGDSEQVTCLERVKKIRQSNYGGGKGEKDAQ